MPEEPEGPVTAEARAKENELLALEAGVLRTRLKEATARLERIRRERDEYRSQVDHLRTELAARPVSAPFPGPVAGAVPPGKVLVDHERHEELRQAQRDLVRLLRRLGRPPLGWVLRRQKGYRRLRKRWLREG
jgi:hypothetical protein